MKCRPLKGFGAFEVVLRSGRRVTSGPLSLSAGGNIDGEEDILRIGVAIPKRVAPLAITRNRVKRLLREGARRHIHPQADRIRACGYTSLILMWRQAPASPTLLHLDDVQRHIEKAVQKLMSS